MSLFSSKQLYVPAMTFEVLNGPTYSARNRPPFWRNENPLVGCSLLIHPDFPQAPLAEFPLIKDFEVHLVNTKSSGCSQGGFQIFFFSPTCGYLAWIDWDHAERALMRKDFVIPNGTFRQPWSECDQGWEIMIAADDDFVYILEGAFDEADPPYSYHIWFKVDKNIYISAWHKAIAACKATFSNLKRFLFVISEFLCRGAKLRRNSSTHPS
jgi:hypothetical protein